MIILPVSFSLLHLILLSLFRSPPPPLSPFFPLLSIASLSCQLRSTPFPNALSPLHFSNGPLKKETFMLDSESSGHYVPLLLISSFLFTFRLFSFLIFVCNILKHNFMRSISYFNAFRIWLLRDYFQVVCLDGTRLGIN